MAAAGKRSPWTATAAVLAGITIVGLALRIPPFGDSLAGDELSTNFVVHGFGVNSLLGLVGSEQEGTPPLFFSLTSLTKGLGGPEGLRVISLLAGVAAIPLTYMLGLRTVGRPAATVGAALIALSPFQIFYATEARSYALVMTLCLLASLALLAALDSGRPWWWVAYAIFMAAAMYTHYTAIFVLAGLFGWAFMAHPRSRRPLLLAGLGAVVLFAPWVPEFREDSRGAAAQLIEYAHPLTLHNARVDLLAWSVGHPLLPLSEMPGSPAVWLIAAGVGVGIAGLLVRLGGERGQGLPRPSSGLILVIVLALATPVGAALENIVASSVFLPRNMLSSSPGLALAAAALVTAGRGGLRAAAVALLVAGFAVGAARTLDQQHQRPDYAGAVAFIERAGPPGSPVVDLPQATPGPQTSMQAALASDGEPEPRDRAVISLDFPSLRTLLTSRRQNRVLLTQLPSPSAGEVAHRAADQAGSGTLFLVTPGSASFDQARGYPGAVADFLAALPPRFHDVEYRTFPGPGAFDVTVYVLRAESAP